MTKLSRKYTDPENFGHYVNNLWSAFTLMDSKEDIRLLFKDLFTHTEYKMFAKRLEIARRLICRERYEDIQHDLNVTPNTITKISNILSEKGEGLRKSHQKLSQTEEKYLHRRQEKVKNLKNPLGGKFQRSTLLGEALKFGTRALDKTIKRKIKQNSARKMLPQ